MRVWGTIGLLVACLACAPAAAARGIDAAAWQSGTVTLNVKKEHVSVPLPGAISAEVDTRTLKELTFRFDDGCALSGQLSIDGAPVRGFTVKSNAKPVGLKASAAGGTHTVRLALEPTGGCGRAVLESSTLREWIPIGSDLGSRYMDGDEPYQELIADKVDSVTAGTDMQWAEIEPRRGVFDFVGSDIVVNFAQENGLYLRGHPLVWRHFLPSYAKSNRMTREQAIETMRVHVQTIVGRYAGVVDEWDVVNEPMAHNRGSLRDVFWRQKIGREYIALALLFAHEADPTAKLFVNDYGQETNNAKSDGFHRLASELIKAGIPIDGVGFQYHADTGSWPETDDMVENLSRFGDLGLEVQITEADVPDNSDDPDSDRVRRIQSDAFEAAAKACKRVVACTRFTMWGLTDRYSWLGTNRRPLPFDRHLKSKPAWAAITEHLRPR